MKNFREVIVLTIQQNFVNLTFCAIFSDLTFWNIFSLFNIL